MERFNVVTGPTGIMGTVAIVFPKSDVGVRALEAGFLKKQSRSNPTPSHATFLPHVTGIPYYRWIGSEVLLHGTQATVLIAACRWTMRAIEVGLLLVECLKASDTSVHAA
jgi:hypothetical protein